MPNRAPHFRHSLHVISGLGLTLITLMASGPKCQADDPVIALENSLVKLVEKTEGAIVSIARYKPNQTQIDRQHRNLFNNNQNESKDDFEELPNEFGAGCLISPPKSTDRLVLTNYHLVRGGPVHLHDDFAAADKTELHVHFADKRACKASILAADPRSDLAILQPSWDLVNPSDYPVLNWETGADPKKGQFVVLFGNPYAIARDGSASVSWGLISNLARQPIAASNKQLSSLEEDANNSSLYWLGSVMQLDARLNLGTSGGPVLNLRGELIGVSTSLAAIEGYEQSAGFAIPIDSLTRRIVRTLLAGQEVEYGMIGVYPVPASPSDLPKGLQQRSAVKISDVTPGSPASKVGLIRDDLVIAVEGQPVTSVPELMKMVGLRAPDTEIEMTIYKRYRATRPPQMETVKIRLGKWAAKDAEGIVESKPRFAPWRGIAVDFSTARSQHLPLSGETQVDHNRVLVSRVVEGSPAHTAQLRAGDFITQVNGKPVKTPKEFYAATAGLSGNVTLRLTDSSNNPESKRTIVVPE